MKKKILYISTNEMWSGSEVLWTESAHSLIDAGYFVAIAVKYDHPAITTLNSKKLNFSNRERLPISRRIFNRLRISKRPPNKLFSYIREIEPNLIIISQGNNIDSLEIMEACISQGIKFITLTQLVTEFHYLQLNNRNLFSFQNAYESAVKNYFVSKKNLSLNNEMLGIELQNSEIIFNPCKIVKRSIPIFPSKKDIFTIGVVGRIEFFHKGIDLLLNVVKENKWQNRPVVFNIYGDGPHVELLKASITFNNIKNIKLKSHFDDVTKIWEECQLLCMPSRMEGQSLSLIEAMYCQRAAVVTNVGGATELIIDGLNGYVAANPTIKDLSEALERAWEDRNNWKNLGIEASNYLKEYSPTDAVDYLNAQILKL